jgi:CRP/FNR family transcriptional regulator
MDKIEALMQLPMFEVVDRSTLDPLASHFIRKEFERGEYLWKEGQEAHNFSFVVAGRVKIAKYRNDGRETILGVFDEGDAVGQIAVFQRMKYPASAIALEDALVLEIYRDHFFGTIRRNPDLLEGVINGMMERNHDLVRRIHELTTGSAEQRLAMLFQKFARKTGLRQKQDDGTMAVYVDLPLSRSDIAELINVRVETAIRIMSRWNKEGPVSTLDDGFLIRDPESLEQLATQS